MEGSDFSEIKLKMINIDDKDEEKVLWHVPIFRLIFVSNNHGNFFQVFLLEQ